MFPFLRKVPGAGSGYQILAFLIPLLPALVPLAIVYLTVTRILSRSFVFNKVVLILLAFYLVHVCGYFYSDNRSAAGFDLEVKLSLILLPLINATDPGLNKESLYKLVKSFVDGCFVAILLCFALSVYRYIITPDPTFFYYSKFSVSLHPSYFSMYLSFSLLGLLYLFEADGKFNYVTLIYITLAIITVVLLSSRAGIISLVITVISCVIYFLARKKIKIASVIVGTSLLLISGALTFSPSVRERFNILLPGKLKSTEQRQHPNDAREQAWASSLSVIKENFLTGTGIGDLNDELAEHYIKFNYAEASAKKINSHNQFLQVFASLGIIGFLIFLFNLATGFFLAITNRSWFFLMFMILISFNFFFESMLQTQAGVVFYAFFFSVFISIVLNSRKVANEHTIN